MGPRAGEHPAQCPVPTNNCSTPSFPGRKKEGKCYFPLCGRRKSSSLLCLDSRTGGFSAEGWYAEPQPGGKREDGGSLSLPCVLRRQRDRPIPPCQSHTDQEASGEDGIREVGQPWTGCHPQFKTKAVSNKTRLVWLRSNGKEGDLEPVKEGERLEVITQYQDWQRTSRLLLKNVKVDDYGEYACFAENQVGTDLAMIQLMVKSSVDILSVVAAITCILGVLLLLATFVYIRLKRKCCQELPQEKC